MRSCAASSCTPTLILPLFRPESSYAVRNACHLAPRRRPARVPSPAAHAIARRHHTGRRSALLTSGAVGEMRRLRDGRAADASPDFGETVWIGLTEMGTLQPPFAYLLPAIHALSDHIQVVAPTRRFRGVRVVRGGAMCDALDPRGRGRRFALRP